MFFHFLLFVGRFSRSSQRSQIIIIVTHTKEMERKILQIEQSSTFDTYHRLEKIFWNFNVTFPLHQTF